MPEKATVILGIESSCDETSAAVMNGTKILANITAGQEVHRSYGGVVPELASRSHQSNIVPVVHEALKTAGIHVKDISAVAYTRGPGLMGSLLVGGSFAKAFSLARNIPLIAVNHMKAHVTAVFIEHEPVLPFICLTVSGGHTQLVRVDSPAEMKLIGETTDDAAGEAFDKGARLLGLPYPGGPLIDKMAAQGDPHKFHFPPPVMPGLAFSFSGIKTSLLYFLKKREKEDPDFIKKNIADICASYQHSIVKALVEKLVLACTMEGVKAMAIGGGVSANSALRAAITEEGKRRGWPVYIPSFGFCTDNAAMIAMAGYYQLQRDELGRQDEPSLARYTF